MFPTWWMDCGPRGGDKEVRKRRTRTSRLERVEDAPMALGPIIEDYDPRKPEYIIPAGVGEVRALEADRLEKQADRLDAFVSRRRRADAAMEDELSHYAEVAAALREETAVAASAEWSPVFPDADFLRTFGKGEGHLEVLDFESSSQTTAGETTLLGLSEEDASFDGAGEASSSPKPASQMPCVEFVFKFFAGRCGPPGGANGASYGAHGARDAPLGRGIQARIPKPAPQASCFDFLFEASAGRRGWKSSPSRVRMAPDSETSGKPRR